METDSNSSKKAFTSYLLGTIILLMAAWLGAKYLQQNSVPTVKKISSSEHTKTYDLDVSYPEFSGPKEISQVNSAIRSMVMKEVKQIKEDISVEPDRSDIKYSGVCEYQVTCASQKFISVRFDFYSYTGGAHGLPYVKTFNCTINPLKELSLPNLLGSSDKETYTYVSKLCGSKLRKQLELDQYLDDSMLKPGVEPTKENFSTFTFNTKGIQMIFQPYQVACYAVGEPTVDLTYEDLKPIISSSSPIFALTR